MIYFHERFSADRNMNKLLFLKADLGDPRFRDLILVQVFYFSTGVKAYCMCLDQVWGRFSPLCIGSSLISNVQSVGYSLRKSSHSCPGFIGAKHRLAKAQSAVTKWIIHSKSCLLLTISMTQLNSNVKVSSHIFEIAAEWNLNSKSCSVLCKSVVPDHNGCVLHYVKRSHPSDEQERGSTDSSRSLNPRTVWIGNVKRASKTTNADRPGGAAEHQSARTFATALSESHCNSC